MTPFLLCSCFRAHPTNTASQTIGGTDAWAVLQPQFFGDGDRPPSPHRSPPTEGAETLVLSQEGLPQADRTKRHIAREAGIS